MTLRAVQQHLHFLLGFGTCLMLVYCFKYFSLTLYDRFTNRLPLLRCAVHLTLHNYLVFLYLHFSFWFPLTVKGASSVELAPMLLLSELLFVVKHLLEDLECELLSGPPILF